MGRARSVLLCPHMVLHPPVGFLGLFLLWLQCSKKGSKNVLLLFQASAYVKLASILLAKESHMVEPNGGQMWPL